MLLRCCCCYCCCCEYEYTYTYSYRTPVRPQSLSTWWQLGSLSQRGEAKTRHGQAHVPLRLRIVGTTARHDTRSRKRAKTHALGPSRSRSRRGYWQLPFSSTPTTGGPWKKLDNLLIVRLRRRPPNLIVQLSMPLRCGIVPTQRSYQSSCRKRACLGLWHAVHGPSYPLRSVLITQILFCGVHNYLRVLTPTTHD